MGEHLGMVDLRVALSFVPTAGDCAGSGRGRELVN